MSFVYVTVWVGSCAIWRRKNNKRGCAWWDLVQFFNIIAEMTNGALYGRVKYNKAHPCMPLQYLLLLGQYTHAFR